MILIVYICFIFLNVSEVFGLNFVFQGRLGNLKKTRDNSMYSRLNKCIKYSCFLNWNLSLTIHVLFSLQHISCLWRWASVEVLFWLRIGIWNINSLRIGHGFDIHRLIEGTKLVIGGVDIPFSKGADAHSDGDAMYHRFQCI